MQEIDSEVSTDDKSYLEQARECIYLIHVARAAIIKAKKDHGYDERVRGNGYIPTSWHRILRSS